MRKIALVLAAGAALAACAAPQPPPPVGVAAQVCFTLWGIDCGAFAVAAIDGARRTLLVQAYDFTEPRIIAAIIAAHRRGVAVTVIVDKAAVHERGEGVDRVAAAQIPTFVDRAPRIAHNKVMVIDGETVLTGSFNWTVSAERRNAENLVALRSPEIAQYYTENFLRRRAAAVPYEAAVRSDAERRVPSS